MMRKLLLILSLAAVPTIAKAETFTVDGGNWSSGGGVLVFAETYEAEGVVAVCGAWTTTRQSTLSLLYNRDVIATGVLYLGGERLLTGFSFMRRLPEGKRPATLSDSECVLTDTPWQPAFAGLDPEIKFPRLRFVLDTDGFGQAITFRQGVKPAFD